MRERSAKSPRAAATLLRKNIRPSFNQKIPENKKGKREKTSAFFVRKRTKEIVHV